MPDYESRSVGVTIYGKMIDEKYTQLLKKDTSLTLKECLWLDAVQKGRPVTTEAVKYLKEKKLIEGKAGRYRISLSVAKMTHQIGQYTKDRGLAHEDLVKMALQLAHNAGEAGFMRKDAYEALQHGVPAGAKESKLRYIGKLLLKMADDGQIKKDISGKRWIVTTKGESDLLS